MKISQSQTRSPAALRTSLAHGSVPQSFRLRGHPQNMPYPHNRSVSLPPVWPLHRRPAEPRGGRVLSQKRDFAQWEDRRAAPVFPALLHIEFVTQKRVFRRRPFTEKNKTSNNPQPTRIQPVRCPGLGLGGSIIKFTASLTTAKEQH